MYKGLLLENPLIRDRLYISFGSTSGLTAGYRTAEEEEIFALDPCPDKYIAPVSAVFCLAATIVDAYIGGIRLNEAIMISGIFFYILLYLFFHDKEEKIAGCEKQLKESVEAIRISDKRMYEDKSKYYLESGKDRRRR